ncbi:MAG: SLBB domain-containing protein, partial [Magnetococcales bacterium]|nr:SLBB domain-containing protein [Magnetococcales bacterium]
MANCTRASRFRTSGWRLFLSLLIAGVLSILPGGLLIAEEEPPPEEVPEINLPVEPVAGGQEAEFLKPLKQLQGLKTAPGITLDQLRAKDGKKAGTQPLIPRQVGTSLLEADYSLRAKASLMQFGYNMFRQVKDRTAPVVGSAPDSYILGVGDELLISFRGRNEKSTTAKIDMEGQVLIPSLAEPLMALGRPFGEFREELREKVRTTQVGTEVFVSIGSFRFFSVYVMGEVTTPGIHRVTGLSTLLDALSAAGGIRKTGSLRAVQLHRNNQVQTIDLYSLLTREGNGNDPTLAIGDRIVVPPIGPVVGISGLVKRPGIYELAPDQKAIDLKALMEFAGGTVSPQGNRYSVLKSDAQDREHLVEVNAAKHPKINNGNIVLVESKLGPTLMGEVGLEGHVSRPHTRSLQSAPTVRTLIADPELLLPDPYLPFGVIYRTDPKTRVRSFLPIDMGLIVGREELDQPLMNHDILIVLSQEDIRFLSSDRVASALQKKPIKNQCIALARLEAVAAASDPLRFSNLFQLQEMGAITGKGTIDAPLPPQESADSLRLTTATQLQETPGAARLNAAIPVAAPTGQEPPAPPCPDLFNKFPDLLPLMLDNSVLLEGNTDRPTLFPVLPGTRMADIIPVAQGVVGATRFDKSLTMKFQIDRKRGAQDSSRNMIALPGPEFPGFVLQPGDVLSFKIGQVSMTGHVVREQQRSLQSVPSARYFLLDADVVKPDPYLLFGVLRRVDPASRNQKLLSVNLDAVLKGENGSDVILQDKDELVILSAQDVRFLSHPLVQSVLLGKPPRKPCASLRHLADLTSASDAYRFSSAINLSITEFEHDKGTAQKATDKTSTMLSAEGPGVQRNDCPAIFERYPEI